MAGSSYSRPQRSGYTTELAEAVHDVVQPLSQGGLAQTRYCALSAEPHAA
jgi:hypothetical protein